MKAVKTIIVTAVVVLGLSTVAMAGVQRLGAAADDGLAEGQAQASPVQQTVAPGSMTLTAAQFAALLKAVGNGRDGAQTGTHARHGATERTHDRRQAHAHAAQTQATGGSTHHATTHPTTHHSTTHRTATHQSTTHHDETHAGQHSGTHGGEGGCD